MAKRSNGEGTIRRRTDGRWECTVMDGFRSDGKRKYRSFYGKTQKEVREQLRQFQEDQAGGLKLDPALRFEEWAKFWYEGHKGNLSPTTVESYRYTLILLIKVFGNRKLMDIKPVDIENYLKELRADGKSDSSISKCRGMLYQIMNKAEANDLIRKNPVRFAEKMRANKTTAKKDAFTADEVKLLMNKLPYDIMGNSIRLLLSTGMRTQELLALEPRHIEPDGSCIHIRQAVKLVKGKVLVGSTKSRDSVRDIPIPEAVQHCARAIRETAKTYVWEVSDAGVPYCPSHFRRKFKEYLCAVGGVRILSPHCCRHTYVSQMQALGVDIQTIQSLVGHAEIDMTEHYLHVQQPVKMSAVGKFSEAFGASANTYTSSP